MESDDGIGPCWRHLGNGCSPCTSDHGLGMDAVRKLLAFASADLDNARRGFPDLTVVYGPGRFEFVEVKGPKDRLRDDQYLWIERLRAARLPVRVARCR